jgi:pilus assembly protein CpaC
MKAKLMKPVLCTVVQGAMLGLLVQSAWAQSSVAGPAALSTPVTKPAVASGQGIGSADSKPASVKPSPVIKVSKVAKISAADTTPLVPGAPLPDTLDLQSAQQREILLNTAIDRIAIADPSVADALVLKSQGGKGHGSLLFFGKRSGSTNLLVWYRGQSQAKSVEIVVDGDGLKGTGLRATASVLSGTASDMVTHANASQLIRQNKLGSSAGSAAGKDSVASGGLIDQSTVATGGTVQVDVKVVEFSKTAMKDVGTNFSFVKGKYFFDSLFGSAVTPLQGAFNLVARVSDTTTASLRLLQGNGMARILAEPTLVAQSGHSASFLAGGEIPIPVPQGLGSVGIEYKQFGIGLAVTPTVLGPNRIALKVAPHASDLDYTNAITINGSAVPALLTRRADTTVELGDGESFIIGGLISKNMISNVNKVPLLGDLPIIGAFFKNLNYRSDEKELVIIVTPRLVRPLARDTDLTAALPGARADQQNGAVWTPYVLHGFSDALPGFSK